MSNNRITAELLNNTFKRWVTEGRRTGALSNDRDYSLQSGSAVNGVSFSVVSRNSNNGLGGTGHSNFPYLGMSKATAHKVLDSMAVAWSLVPTNAIEPAMVRPVLDPNQIEVTIYGVDRLDNSVAGNPRYRLRTSEGNYVTQYDASLNFSIVNLTNSRYPDTYVIGEDVPPVVLTLSPAGRVTHIHKNGKSL